MNWNMRVQYFLMTPLTLTAIALLVTVYRAWWIPAKFTLFLLMMVTAGLLAVHILQRQHKKSKEMTLVASMIIYLILIISLAIRDVWKWKAIFDKQAMTQFSLVLLGLLGACGIVAYYRAKVSYKRIKGNQQNSQWGISTTKKRKLKASDDIYLNLGTIYENIKE